MLVITDQRARGIGRQGGLAGAAEAEEQGRRTVVAGIGRAVHRHDALFRQEVVECTEDRLLGFAGVFAVTDEHQLVSQVDCDHRFGAAAMLGRVSLETWLVDDGQLRREAHHFFARRTAQQIADKQRVPGKLGDHAHLDAMLRISTAIQVLHEQAFALGMGQEVALQRLEVVRRHRLVVVPPDVGFGVGIAHDELVLRRTAGVLAGGDGKVATVRQHAFAKLQGHFQKLRGVEIVVDFVCTLDTCRLDGECRVEMTRVFQVSTPVSGLRRRMCD
jgi:hypothetical protein